MCVLMIVISVAVCVEANCITIIPLHVYHLPFITWLCVACLKCRPIHLYICVCVLSAARVVWIYYINVKFCLYVLYTNQQFVILSYQTLHTLYYYPNLNFSNIFKFIKPPCHGQGSKNSLVPYISASSECIIFPSLTLPFT